ncbi:hypothetical protein JCM8097_008521 [Rhodosporidiobolus ruineniae]
MLGLRSLALLLPLVAAVVSASDPASSRVQLKPGEQDAQGRPTYTLGVDPSEGFTMMLATYNRDQNLQPLLKHLTTSPPPSLRHIVLIWQNVGRALPDFLNSTALAAYSTSGVAVTVRVSEKNSMNERFRPLRDWDEEVYTDAVMIMDDDVVLRRDALEWGYQEFVRANERGEGRLVGFTGRDFEEKKGGKEWEYVVRPKTTYSMVLSNAAWLKKEWLQKYWEETDEMRGLRDYVDEVFNCDDILINYLVSNLTGNPPLLLQPVPPLRTIGGGGLALRGSVPVDPSDPAFDHPSPSDDAGTNGATPSAGHFTQRAQCLAHYFSHFSRFAPPASNYKSPQAAQAAARHFPLRKTRTSASMDVEDHSRWLFRHEPWEAVVFRAAVPSVAEELAEEPWEDELDSAEGEGDGEGGGRELSEEEKRERDEFDEMLAGLSDEELEELIASLGEMIEEDEGPSDGEEGLGEEEEGQSVFEVDEEQVVLGHVPGEL